MSTPLRVEREKRGMTTEELAIAVGVRQPTISRVESGRSRPSPELADRLAKYFGNAVTRDQILFPEDYVEAAPPMKPIRSRLAKAS
jgi:transcriptional regulator with XRE-family HTH domain